MAVVLRFVDKEDQIREEFISFMHCDTGLSGESLAKLIVDKVHALDRSMH